MPPDQVPFSKSLIKYRFQNLGSKIQRKPRVVWLVVIRGFCNLRKSSKSSRSHPYLLSLWAVQFCQPTFYRFCLLMFCLGFLSRKYFPKDFPAYCLPRCKCAILQNEQTLPWIAANKFANLINFILFSDTHNFTIFLLLSNQSDKVSLNLLKHIGFVLIWITRNISNILKNGLPYENLNLMCSVLYLDKMK